jgi:hypothetical protein
MPSRTRPLQASVAPTRRQRNAPKRPAEGAKSIAAARVAFATEALAKTGKLHGARTRKLSVRVDPGLLEAARSRTGIRSDSDLVNAALATLAAPDGFGAWFVAYKGRLPEDFELGF